MRSARVLLLALAGLMAVGLATDARGDFGRNGGIVVLPSAVPFPDSGKVLRQQYVFRAGSSLQARLPLNLRNSVFAVSLGVSQPVSLGRVSGGDYVILQEDFERLAGAGVQEVNIRFVGADGMALHLRLLLSVDSSFELQVW